MANLLWSRAPLLRLIIPFVSGIILSYGYDGQMSYARWGMYGLSSAVFAGGLLYPLFFTYRRRWMFGFMIIMMMFFAGLSASEGRKEKRAETLALISPEKLTYVVMIEECFELRERSCRGVVSLQYVEDGDSLRPCKGKVMVYTAVDSTLPAIPAGRYMLIHASLKEVQQPLNPGGFDYRGYLARSGIYHSTYLQAGTWEIDKKGAAFNLRHYASGLRQMMLEKLQLHGISGAELGVSAAMLLGDSSHLGDEVRDVYARAGAMHVLCVSGLHVGVVFLVMNTVFGFLRRSRAGKALLPFLLLAIIWAYALLTGLAPPVVRASSMISFLIAGGAMKRQTNVYNTLAASAFLMLLFDPYVIFGAGFQLSYSAVLGIVSVQRPIYRLLYVPYRIPDRIWAITAVSLAAQLGTLPLVLYYFRQFPVYSLLTNLIVIPLSSLIIYAGLLMLLLPVAWQAAALFAWILQKLLFVMDRGVSLVEALPYSAVTDISIDGPMAFFICLIAGAAGLCLANNSRKAFMFALFATLMLSSYRLVMHYGQLWQEGLVVYAVRGHTAIDVFAGRSCLFVSDSSLAADPALLEYNIRPYRMRKGLVEQGNVLLAGVAGKPDAPGRLFYIPAGERRVALWEGKLPRVPGPGRLRLDCLVLRGSCPYRTTGLLEFLDPAMIIIDGSVPWWKARDMKQADSTKVVWDVLERGAWVIESLQDGNSTGMISAR